MRNKTRNLFVFAVAAALAVATLPLHAAPATQGPVADVFLGNTQVQWTPKAEFDGLRLTISGPHGIELFEFGPGESPLLDLASVVADIDGQYSWELRATPKVDVTAIAAAARTPGFEAGERQRPADLPPEHDLVQSGSFRVVDGAIVQPAVESGPDLMVDGAGLDQVAGDAVTHVTGEQVITGDLTVRFSLCVGGDCANAESYGADTIRLKENNLRIHFNDTSNSASFPTNDWRIQINDSSNGGDSYFSVIDVDGGRTPFRLDAGAPNNALRIQSSGNVGMGTDNPVLQLHILDGNTPSLRLDQDSSAGFQTQIWDLAGNETNFFVRDITSGSTLPFRVKPGSGNDDAIVIAANGDVGMGTDAPAEEMHMVGSANPRFLIEDNVDDANDKPGVALRSPAAASSGDWLFEVDNAGNFQIDFGPSSGPEIVISDTTGTTNGTVTINGNLMVNGTCTGCDDVFSASFPLESISEHAELMWKNSYLPGVGPTPDGPGLINVFEKTTGILQELEKAHIYIAQLHERLEMLENKLEATNEQEE